MLETDANQCAQTTGSSVSGGAINGAGKISTATSKLEPHRAKDPQGNLLERVRKVFKMAAEGVGAVSITKTLGDKFSLTWYTRLLNDRAVLGEFQSKDSDPIPDYFPQISQSEFDAVRAVIDSKHKNGRYAGGNKRNSLQADNLFSGIIFDFPIYDDAAPVRALHFNKVQRGTYLMSAFSRDQKQNRIQYDLVESAVLQFLTKGDWQSVAGQTESDECKAARAELEVLLREIDVAERRIQRNSEAMDGEDIDVSAVKVLAGKVAKDEASLETLKPI